MSDHLKFSLPSKSLRSEPSFSGGSPEKTSSGGRISLEKQIVDLEDWREPLRLSNKIGVFHFRSIFSECALDSISQERFGSGGQMEDAIYTALLMRAGERQVNLLKYVPSSYRVLTSFAYDDRAAMDPNKRELYVGSFAAKGHVISFLHEAAHAVRFENMSKEATRRLLETSRAFLHKETSLAQRRIWIEEEQAVWEATRVSLKTLDRDLGITFCPDQNALDAFIQKRIQTYQKHVL